MKKLLVGLAIIGCAVVYGSEWVGDLLDGTNGVKKSAALQQEHLREQLFQERGKDRLTAIVDHQMRLERAARVLSRIVTCINAHVVRHQEREAMADCHYHDDEATAFHEDETSGRISNEESNALMEHAEDSAPVGPR